STLCILICQNWMFSHLFWGVQLFLEQCSYIDCKRYNVCGNYSGVLTKEYYTPFQIRLKPNKK
ncbi:hypothetical protein V7088_03465, partial [Priestia megaterium]|uniref:hypothetical protein n=1 Tax=Priestia megaterium TaxID=1404 RepID=UPI0030006263